MENLEIRTGVDLVKIEEFRASLERGGEPLLHRLFRPSETAGASLERLVGIFAIKEAAYKALALPKGNWHTIEVNHTPEGKPSLSFAPDYDSSHVLSWDVSVSHTGEYVVASVAALVRH